MFTNLAHFRFTNRKVRIQKSRELMRMQQTLNLSRLAFQDGDSVVLREETWLKRVRYSTLSGKK